MTLFYNRPVSPAELQILKVLKKRMALPPESLKLYQNLQKGYEGEVKFHKFLKEHLDLDCIVLYDLLLDSNNSVFQIDCIIIQQTNIWYLEIKNFEGDFIFRDNEMFSLVTEKEIHNPLNQVSRGKRLLKELQEKHGYKFPVTSNVVFTHPEFILYQAQTNLPFIYPGQIHRFIKKISSRRSKLSSAHHKLAQTLFSIQVSQSPYERLPKYEFKELGKGIHCLHCDGALASGDPHGRKLICDSCGFPESRESAVLRSVDEFSTLFPKSKITTNTIWAWCGGIISKYKIRKTLFQFLEPIGSQKNLYFISPF